MPPPTAGQPPGPSVCTAVLVVPPSPLAVAKGTELKLRFDPLLPASQITVVRRPSGDHLNQPIVQTLSLPPGSGGSFGATFPAGTWDVEVTAQFPQGLVPYFFRIRVEDRTRTPATPAKLTLTG